MRIIGWGWNLLFSKQASFLSLPGRVGSLAPGVALGFSLEFLGGGEDLGAGSFLSKCWKEEPFFSEETWKAEE